MKKIIFAVVSVLASLNAYAANEGTVKVDLIGSTEMANVEIRGEAAKTMYAVLLANGIKPTSTAHKGLLLGQNLSCYLDFDSGEPICSFNMIGGNTEPDVTDGIHPTPGVTVSN